MTGGVVARSEDRKRRRTKGRRARRKPVRGDGGHRRVRGRGSGGVAVPDAAPRTRSPRLFQPNSDKESKPGGGSLIRRICCWHARILSKNLGFSESRWGEGMRGKKGGWSMVLKENQEGCWGFWGSKNAAVLPSGSAPRSRFLPP